jgi:hypothetical protein
VALADSNLLHWLGFSTQGDLGPLTFYTSRRRILVFYNKAPPLNPPSTRQIMLYNRWRAAAAVWRRKTPQDRAQWLLAGKRLAAPITGYNLWVYWFTRRRTSDIRTIERQTQTTLLPS